VSGGDFITDLWSRLAFYALKRARRRQTSDERIETLSELQTGMLKGIGGEEEDMLRGYAVETTATCVRRLPPRGQLRTIVSTANRALKEMDPKSVLYACASLSDLVRVHPRMVDPASYTARAKDERPLVVGPWLMEVGFELLYWLPYLRAQLASLGIEKERVIAISRGGAEPWYADIAGRYLDVLDVMTPQEFQAWTSEAEDSADGAPANRKPFEAGPFETEILDRVLGPAGSSDYQRIMPSAMYGLLRNLWRSRYGAHRLEKYLAPARIARPAPVKLHFKGPYVAVKLYNSLTFPATAETRSFAQTLVKRLAQQSHVVLLSNPACLDDHDTMTLAGGEGAFEVFDASSLYAPRDNLAVQTALVAGAEALHGTYGGFSYLGPLLGVDTFAYTDNFDFTSTHLDLAWRTFEALDVEHLAIVPVGQGLRLFADREISKPSLKSEAAA
jgi:hypothetical protein